MTKIDIFSGFLGAGKTTLIKKLIREAYAGEQLVLIENEFGEIGIDGGFLQDAGVNITEMNSGCICCSLVGDFGKALAKVLEEYHPDRILIEPSGVGKLSDVIRAVQGVEGDVTLNTFTTVVDANKCRVYMKNFGEFFNNQVEHASAIVLSHTAGMSREKLDQCTAMLREHNADAVLITTDWDALDGAEILRAMERRDTLALALEQLAQEAEEHHHHHHDEDDECDCGCHDHHHHHDDDDDDEEHEHHHHHHDHDDGEHEHHHHDHDDHDEDDEHEHHHHHEHGEECTCGCHDHDHHHHHADEVFTSFGRETTHTYTAQFLTDALSALMDSDTYGTVLRAKGIVAGEGGKWLHFDYVPGEPDVREGSAGITGRLCVIGSNLNEQKLAELFAL